MFLAVWGRPPPEAFPMEASPSFLHGLCVLDRLRSPAACHQRKFSDKQFEM